MKISSNMPGIIGCPAQDEASCVVFGMPKQAIKVGAVDDILPLEQISQKLVNLLNQ